MIDKLCDIISTVSCTREVMQKEKMKAAVIYKRKGNIVDDKEEELTARRHIYTRQQCSTLAHEPSKGKEE